MALTPLDVLQASFSILFVLISIITGLKIASKYFTYKVRELFLLGIFWIGITSPWWPNIITFLLILLFNAPVTIANFLLLGFAFLPITVLVGLVAFTKPLSLKKEKRIMIISLVAIPNILFEILLFYFYFVDLAVIATVSDPLTIQYTLFSQFYFIFALLVFLLTGIAFSRDLLKSKDYLPKLKGKLLLAAFISFVAGTILDFSMSLTITYVIARLILVSSTFEFYMGLIFPDWTKKLLFKEK